jgi:uncharacterized protein (TIGR03792 family)
MIIEFLKVQVIPSYRQKYIELEQQIWTTDLVKREGFINKEVWVDPEDLSIVYVRILWNSREQWKAISPEHIKKLDAALAEHIGLVWQIVESKECLYVSHIGQDSAVCDETLL